MDTLGRVKMSFKHFVYILLILGRNIKNVESDDVEVYRMSDKVISCSKWLSILIDNFCNNVYKIVKRDTSSLFMDKLMPRELQLIKNKQRELGEKRWRRVRRQVASECCERPCTVRNILMYCPEDAKLLKENPSIFD